MRPLSDPFASGLLRSRLHADTVGSFGYQHFELLWCLGWSVLCDTKDLQGGSLPTSNCCRSPRPQSHFAAPPADRRNLGRVEHSIGSPFSPAIRLDRLYPCFPRSPATLHSAPFHPPRWSGAPFSLLASSQPILLLAADGSSSGSRWSALTEIREQLRDKEKQMLVGGEYRLATRLICALRVLLHREEEEEEEQLSTLLRTSDDGTMCVMVCLRHTAPCST